MILTLSQTTNFGLVQTDKSLQTTISNLMKIAEISTNGWKTLWEKKKLLVTSDFFFSHSVFKRLVLQTHKTQGFFGETVKHGGTLSNEVNKNFQWFILSINSEEKLKTTLKAECTKCTIELFGVVLSFPTVQSTGTKIGSTDNYPQRRCYFSTACLWGQRQVKTS